MPNVPPVTRVRAASLAGLVLGALVACANVAWADKPVADAPVPVTIEARPITAFSPADHSRTRFGKLVFRGGLVLTSNDRDFGGISGLALDAKGERFVALSDHGDWFTGFIRYEDERPAALEHVEAGPLLAGDGRTLASHGWYDTESLTLDGDIAYVGIERAHQIVRFDASKGFLRARGSPVAAPPEIKRLPANKGIEGLVHVPKGLPLAGALIAFSERGLDAGGNLKAFLIGGPKPGAFTLKRSEDFDVSDAALLPGGDILVLERKFSFTSGLGLRLRRISQDAIAPGATVEGEIIFDADMAYEVDNLEALAVHRAPTGETVLTLMSDDNFSRLQRTILLQFTLLDTD